MPTWGEVFLLCVAHMHGTRARAAAPCALPLRAFPSWRLPGARKRALCDGSAQSSPAATEGTRGYQSTAPAQINQSRNPRQDAPG